MRVPAQARLIIVDDEVAQLNALSFTLNDAGYSVRGFTSPQEALACLARERFDLLLTDLNMPGLDGMDLMRAAQEHDRDLVTIVMTGNGTIDTAVAAMRGGALDFIRKPFKLSAILPVLERAISVRRLRRENAELLARVAERTASLEAANKELEAFSYSVSHDLRAPLRHVQGFAALLQGKFSADLPAEAQRHLETIMDGARRMGRLIEDLLAFSRFNRQPLSTQRVDMDAIVGQVVAEMSAANPDRTIELRIGGLPACHGDPALLRQVWANLIGNACKFTGKRDNPVIEIGSRREDRDTVYFVRDNGAGFDMRHVEKLFGVFQRFHSEEDFQGTGVGLSIVQRIILRHGGRVWAQSAEGEGATFSFQLPLYVG